MAKFKDITGQKFGKLIVIKHIRTEPSTSIWLCRCQCDNEKEVRLTNLRNGTTKSCGCLIKEFNQARSKDLTGKMVGLLTVIRKTEKRTNLKKPLLIWECVCICGKTVELSSAVILRRTGKNGSCGCRKGYKPENHNSWKGGRINTQEGYIYIYSPEHPNANNTGYIFEHRLIIEKEIGRYLLPNENIHHINGIKNDNRIENLELWVKTQPAGQRAKDLVSFAREILKQYGELFPETAAAR